MSIINKIFGENVNKVRANKDMKLAYNNGKIYITNVDKLHRLEEIEMKKSKADKESIKKLIDLGYLKEYGEYGEIILEDFENNNLEDRVCELIEIVNFTRPYIKNMLKKHLDISISKNQKLITSLIDRLIFEFISDTMNVFRDIDYKTIFDSFKEQSTMNQHNNGIHVLMTNMEASGLSVIETKSQITGKITNLIMSLPNLITLHGFINSEEGLEYNSTFFTSLIEMLVMNISLVIIKTLKDIDKGYIRQWENDEIINFGAPVNLFNRPMVDYTLLNNDVTLELGFLLDILSKYSKLEEGNGAKRIGFINPVCLTKIFIPDTKLPFQTDNIEREIYNKNEPVTVEENIEYLKYLKELWDSKIGINKRKDYYLDFKNMNNFSLAKELKIYANDEIFDTGVADLNNKFDKILTKDISIESALFGVYYDLFIIKEDTSISYNFELERIDINPIMQRINSLCSNLDNVKISKELKFDTTLVMILNDLKKILTEFKTTNIIKLRILLLSQETRIAFTAVVYRLRMLELVNKSNMIHHFLEFLDTVSQGVMSCSSEVTHDILFNPGIFSNKVRNYSNITFKSISLYASNMYLLNKNAFKLLEVDINNKVDHSASEYVSFITLLYYFLDMKTGNNSGCKPFSRCNIGMIYFSTFIRKYDKRREGDCTTPNNGYMKFSKENIKIFFNSIKSIRMENKDLILKKITEFVFRDLCTRKNTFNHHGIIHYKTKDKINETNEIIKEFSNLTDSFIDGKKIPLSFLIANVVSMVGNWNLERVQNLPTATHNNFNRLGNSALYKIFGSTLNNPFLVTSKKSSLTIEELSIDNFIPKKEILNISEETSKLIRETFRDIIINQKDFSIDYMDFTNGGEKYYNADIESIDDQCTNLIYSNILFSNELGIRSSVKNILYILKLMKMAGVYDIEKNRIMTCYNMVENIFSTEQINRDDSSLSDINSDQKENYGDYLLHTIPFSLKSKTEIEEYNALNSIDFKITDLKSIFKSDSLSKNDSVMLLVINRIDLISRYIQSYSTTTNIIDTIVNFVKNNTEEVEIFLQNNSKIFIKISRMNVETSILEIFMKSLTMFCMFGENKTNEILANLSTNKTNQFLISFKNFSFAGSKFLNVPNNPFGYRLNNNNEDYRMDVKTLLNTMTSLYSIISDNPINYYYSIMLLRIFKGDVEKIYRCIMESKYSEMHLFLTSDMPLMIINNMIENKHINKLFDKLEKIFKDRFSLSILNKLLSVLHFNTERIITNKEIDEIPINRYEVEEYINRKHKNNLYSLFEERSGVNIEKDGIILDKQIDIPKDWVYGKSDDGSDDIYSIHFHDKDDPTAIELGNITNCCQTLTNVAASCVIQGILNPYAGFISYQRNGKIIGQSYIWLTVDEEYLVIDSVESRYNNYSNLFTKMIMKYATEIKYKVALGGSYSKINPNLLQDRTLYSSIENDNKHYKRTFQYLLNENKDTKTIEEGIDYFINTKGVDNKTNTNVLNQLINLPSKLKEMLEVYKHYFGVDYQVQLSVSSDFNYRVKINGDDINENSLIFCKVPLNNNAVNSLYTDAKQFFIIKK